MVIEFLTFDIATADQKAWVNVDRETWTAYLESMPGFIRKELWVDRDAPHRVHAVIWWQDDASWAACDHDVMRSIDAEMGALHRVGTLRTFDVVAHDPGIS